MRLALVAVAVLLGCASAPPAGKAPDRESGPAPSWIDMHGSPAEKLFAREFRDLGEVAISSPGGRYTATTLAREPVRVLADGDTESFSAAFAADEKLECTVRATRVYHGDGVRRMVETLRKSADVRAIVPADVEAVEGGPLLFVDVVYVAGQGSQAGVGEFKIAYYSRTGLSVICAHDAPGYRDTFVRAVLSLARTIKDAQAKPEDAVQYAAIYRVRMESRVVGWSEEREFVPGADGSRWHDSFSSYLFPAKDGPQAMTVRDLSRSDLFGADEVLRRGQYAVGRDSVWTEFEMRKGEEGSYEIEGTEGDRPLKGTVRSEQGIRDVAASELLGVLAGRTKELSFDFYSPVRPLEVTPGFVRADPAVQRGVVYDTKGKVPILSASLDEAGAPRTTSAPLGDRLALVAQRIWSRGKPH